MKKTILVAILCLLTAFCIYAEDLTTEQQKIYNAQALSVQERVETSGRSTGSAFSTSRYTAVAFGRSESTSTIEWDAYQGANKISKVDFFKIAGYPDYEQLCLDTIAQNEQNKTLGMRLMIIGTAGAIAGLTCEFIGISKKNNIQMYVGAGIGLLSLFPAIWGLNLYSNSDSEPDISTSFAMGVADIYNQELQASIKLNY